MAENGSGAILAEFRPDSVKTDSMAAAALEDRWRYFVDFGGERVDMAPADKVALKKSANANSDFASLILLGFKEKHSVPISHRLEQTYYAYPSEERTEGSVPAFAHLHASMLRKGVLAIGELLSRVSATSRLVAMWPLEPVEEPNSKEHEPMGNVVKLH